jgi:putative ABC transport system substrate-binding protein
MPSPWGTSRRGLLRMIVVGLLATAATAEAQPPPRAPRVGWLTSSVVHESNLKAFQEGMRALGYDGVAMEFRAAAGQTERLPELAAELVRAKVDVVVVDGGPAVIAARRTITSLPVVFGAMADPLGDGVVASLARPGGNVTGFSIATGPELNGKRLDLIREVVPDLGRVGVVWNETNRTARAGMEHVVGAARALGIEAVTLGVRDAAGIGRGFAEAARVRVGAVLAVPDAFFWSQRHLIVASAARYKLPAIYPEPEFAHAGGLLAYGPNVPDNFRRAAGYVDKILKGARPADLPVEQPTRFELVVNLKTARPLGLVIPQTLLLRADQILE